MSGPTKRVVIIHGPEGSLAARPYFVRVLVPEWEARGWSVTVVEDSRRFVPADVAIAHIDATVVPARWLELLGRYSRVVNGSLTDISKRKVSEPVLFDLETWQGPVLVKTDANCGGGAERAWLLERLERRFRPLRQAGRVALKVGDYLRGFHPARPYPVFSSLADVPARLRRNPDLVVQRFVPERDGELYAMRLMTFFRGHSFTIRSRSTEPVVKAGGTVDVTPVDSTPEVLERARAIGCHYGKIDFALHDGSPVIFDVNRTPTFHGEKPNERHLLVARTLAPGLDAMLEG